MKILQINPQELKPAEYNPRKLMGELKIALRQAKNDKDYYMTDQIKNRIKKLRKILRQKKKNE